MVVLARKFPSPCRSWSGRPWRAPGCCGSVPSVAPNGSHSEEIKASRSRMVGCFAWLGRSIILIMDDRRAGVVSTDHWPKRACLLADAAVGRDRLPSVAAATCPTLLRTFPYHTTGITPDEIAPSLDRRALGDGVEFGPCPAWGRCGRLRAAPARRHGQGQRHCQRFRGKALLAAWRRSKSRCEQGSRVALARRERGSGLGGRIPARPQPDLAPCRCPHHATDRRAHHRDSPGLSRGLERSGGGSHLRIPGAQRWGGGLLGRRTRAQRVRPALPLRGVRRLRGGYSRAEGNRLPDVLGPA